MKVKYTEHDAEPVDESLLGEHVAYPPLLNGYLPSRPVHCTVCGSVHNNNAERFRCLEGQ